MIIVYTIPATGHIFSMLAVIESLVNKGNDVVVYSCEAYRQCIEGVGACLALYPLDESEINLKDGSRILKFHRKILGYTAQMLPQLLAEAMDYSPCFILHDSAAHWGKRLGEMLGVPAASFCSFLSVGKRFSIAALLYVINFFITSIKDYKELFISAKHIKGLQKEYHFKGFDFVEVLLSHEKFNIISYPKMLQPDAKSFQKTTFFLGPTATLRKSDENTNMLFSECKVKIYVSMGTILNDNIIFYEQLIAQLKKTQYQIYISDGSGVLDIPEEYKGQFTVKRFFNQIQMLDNVDLFITQGGVNSLCESIKAGVPCLMFPQQGEQKIACKMIQKLGFGIVAKKHKAIVPQIENALQLKKTWDTHKGELFSVVHMDELMGLLEDYIGQ